MHCQTQSISPVNFGYVPISFYMALTLLIVKSCHVKLTALSHIVHIALRCYSYLWREERSSRMALFSTCSAGFYTSKIVNMFTLFDRDNRLYQLWLPGSRMLMLNSLSIKGIVVCVRADLEKEVMLWMFSFSFSMLIRFSLAHTKEKVKSPHKRKLFSSTGAWLLNYLKCLVYYPVIGLHHPKNSSA